MFTLFKKIFAKTPTAPEPLPQTPMPRATAVPSHGPTTVGGSESTMPHVQVAHLSLAAILGKLPADLRQNVAQMPDAETTVVLPLATIQKQLPTGSVKMSLASLYRQAPAGTFSRARVEEKRMVEVPLSEVMRHVNPGTLRRRADQRRLEVPEDAPQLFGDRENPYALRPSVPEPAPQPSPTPAIPPAAPAALAPSREMFSHVTPEPVAPVKTARRSPGLTAAPAPAQATILPPANGDDVVLLPISELCANWPEPIRSEAAALDGASVALPASIVSAGLAKGKVTFSWGQIRAWLTPPPEQGTVAREGTDLQLPLKVVAPAFLKARPSTGRKTVDVGDIPELFTGGNPPPAPKPTPAAAPEPEPEPEPLAPPMALAPEPAMRLAPPVPMPEPEAAAPEPAAPIAAPKPSAESHSIGDLFGQPAKTQWSLPELVKETAKLPGVAGSIVALQEGLVVAAELPAHLKSDAVAAFLPQMFARMNTYSNEMALGEIEDVLFSANGAYFQIYRVGEIYFAALGQPGAALPWDGMRMVVAELARQNAR